MAGAVAVLGPPGQRRALDGLAGAATLHRGGVHDPHVIVHSAVSVATARMIWRSSSVVRRRRLL
jgi:hypothetical protein